MRFILNKNIDVPIREMLIKLNLFSKKQIIFYHTRKVIFNVRCGNAPEYLTNNILYINDMHELNTSNKNKIKLPLFRIEKLDQNR